MTDDTDRRLSRPLIALLAVAVGTSSANLYYVQPLLAAVAREVGVSSSAAGLLVTCAQVGYVTGLLLLVPIADIVERRRPAGDLPARRRPRRHGPAHLDRH